MATKNYYLRGEKTLYIELEDMSLVIHAGSPPDEKASSKDELADWDPGLIHAKRAGNSMRLTRHNSHLGNES